MDGNLTVIDVINRDDLQHATRAVGADEEHPSIWSTLVSTSAGCHGVADRVVDVWVSDPMASSAAPELHPLHVSHYWVVGLST